MKPMHLLAAALLAAGGLALSTPAEAAPAGGPGVAAVSDDVVLAGHRDRDGDRDWRRHRGRDDDWRRHRRGDDDDWRRGRRGDDWRDDDWRDDDWRRHGWRDDDRDRRHRHGKWDHDRGKHKGWHRGRGHDRHWDRKHRKEWAKERRKWAKERRRWLSRHHPRHGHWVGRPFRHDRFSRIRDYDHYRLPPPWRGQFYARSGNDVFLVDEVTRQIVDAFVLYNLLGR